MEQNGRNVQTIRAGHTILAVVAGNRVELHHPCSRLLQELEILLRQRLQWSVGAQVVLQMLHTGHAAQHGMHARQAAGKTERPRSHAHLRLALLEAGHNGARHVGEPTAQQRFHDDSRNTALFQFAIQIFGICIPRIDLLGVLPVQIIQLDLHEVPLVFIVSGEQIIEYPDISVIRKTEIANTSRLALLQQKVEDTVIHVAVFKLLHAATHTHAMQ